MVMTSSEPMMVAKGVFKSCDTDDSICRCRYSRISSCEGVGV